SSQLCVFCCAFKSAIPSPALLNPKKGWCQKHSTRYYYDSKLHQCREFNYHGCGGNENNFSNYIDCVKACDVFGTYTISQHLYLHFSYDEINVSETTFSPSPSLSFLPVFLPQKCKLPPKKGRCNEDFENFYYDHNSNMCKTFIFGGCGGNKNNFTFNQCNKACDAFGTRDWTTICLKWYMIFCLIRRLDRRAARSLPTLLFCYTETSCISLFKIMHMLNISAR
uniref:BPTI/Kunitz inhibitor domain-containing protein n=1 Tax=Naja naja TaxID=35670 RepID=A0A8C6XCC6_NAJNA